MTSKVLYQEVTEKRPAKSGSSTTRFTEKANHIWFLIDRDCDPLSSRFTNCGHHLFSV